MAANNRTPIEVATKATTELAKIFDPNTGRSFFEFIAESATGKDGSASNNTSADSIIAQKLMDVSKGGILTRDLLADGVFEGMKPDDAKKFAGVLNFITYETVKKDAQTAAKNACVPISLDTAMGAQKQNTPGKPTPDVSSVVVYSPYLNLSERDTGAVAVFMNSIPTIEFSRCVPYFDVTIITPGSPLDSQSRPQGISLFRFLNGRDPLKSDGDKNFINAYPVESAADIKSKTNLDISATAVTGSNFAGMEVFTSPQTLINADEVYRDYAELAATPKVDRPTNGDAPYPGMPGARRTAAVIDRMRPFMTLRSFEISVAPSRGTMTTKSAKMAFTLHDRSRLGEIAEFVKPASYGKTELLVEWGWSHPDGLTGDNAIGAFLNSLRVREKYAVYNSSYSFTDDGQVEISVDMVTKGVDSVNWTDVATDSETKQTWMAIEGLIEAVRKYRTEVLKDEDMKDIAGMSVISSISPSNVADVFSGEKSKEIDDFLAAWKNTKNSTPEIQGLVTSLSDLNKKVDAQTATLGKTLAKKQAVLSNGIDPFFYKNDGSSASSKQWLLPNTAHFIANTGVKENASKTGATGFVSFGKLMQLYVAEPLATNGNFDEVQMCFYTFNDKAGYYASTTDKSSLPISCFPIPVKMAKKGFIERFNVELKNYVQFPVGRFVNWVTNTYLGSMASPGYGLSKSYTYDDAGKTTTTLKDDKNAPATLKNQKDGVLRQVYYNTSDAAPGQELIFKMPKINMIFEVIPVNPANLKQAGNASEKTILRIHFVDASAGKYTGLGQILSAKKSSTIGSISKDPTKEKTQTITAAVNAGIIQLEGNYYRVTGGPPQVKHFAKRNMPSITVGSVGSALIGASAQSMNDSKDATIHMLRAQKNAGSPTEAPSDEQDRGLPMRMMPFDISIECIGCPLLAHTQQFFVDFGTNTSIDNIYAVCGVDHKLEPGSFTTSAKLIPVADAYGSYESLFSIIDKLPTAKPTA